MKRIPIPVTLEKDGEKHEFPSLKKAGEFLGITTAEVSQARHTCRGWKIEFLGERPKAKTLNCKVFMFDMDGKFLQEFKSIHECARHLCRRPHDIWATLNNYGRGQGKNIFNGQYILRYTKQNDDTYDPADFA
jgi:hypothetical protein